MANLKPRQNTFIACMGRGVGAGPFVPLFLLNSHSEWPGLNELIWLGRGLGITCIIVNVVCCSYCPGDAYVQLSENTCTIVENIGSCKKMSMGRL